MRRKFSGFQNYAWVYHMDNRCPAIVERWLTSQGSGTGKDAMVSRSLEPVKASENGPGNITGAGDLNVAYILSKFFPWRATFLVYTHVLESYCLHIGQYTMSYRAVFCVLFFSTLYPVSRVFEQNLPRRMPVMNMRLPLWYLGPVLAKAVFYFFLFIFLWDCLLKCQNACLRVKPNS